MKFAGNAVVLVALLGCASALAVSVYPGVLNDVVLLGFFAAVFVVPVAGVFALIAALHVAQEGRWRRLCVPWRHIAVALAIMLGTYAVLKVYVPRRIAFAASRTSFEKMLASAPQSEFQGKSLRRRLGVYQVDAYAADLRGGVYFRVYRGSDGIGPNTMSYGFAYEPNREGTPFGAAGYRVYRLGDGWYWFHASDDWY